MQMVLSADFGRGNEISLGFVLNRHAAQVLNDTPMGVKVGLTSTVDPADLFHARVDELVDNLKMYGFDVSGVRIVDDSPVELPVAA